MTVKEMREALETECNKHDENCNGCPLHNITHPCVGYLSGYVVDEKAVKEQYQILTCDPVSHPSHYTQGGIECIDAMEAAFGKEAVSHFCICNAFKYVFRHEHKNGKEDIEKAEWYLNKYKELKYSE